MKMKSTLFCLAFALFTNICITVNAQVNQHDSLALVDLYNSTNGPNWKHHTNWLTSAPLSSWWGVTVTNARVTQIHLPANYLEGNIPSSLGHIVNLVELGLSTNRLSGSIPASLGNLINLQRLDFHYNQLSGDIPSSLGNLVNLQNLALDINQLTGSIPSSIGNLTNLQDLGLIKNKLSGNIPSSIGNLVNLEYVGLQYNELSGSIPSSIGNLVKLWGLFLDFNKLSGSIPSSIGNLINLEYLQASHNKLSGIPSSIGKMVRLFTLHLNNNELRGSIPSSIGNLTRLDELNLSFNHLSGSIPSSFGNLSNLGFAYLSHNELSGSIPSSFGNLDLYKLDLSYNRLSGTISSSLGKLVNLHGNGFLNLSHNHYTFDAMEFIAQNFPNSIYYPQANIPIHQNGNTLSVSAGGTLSNNTYKWFKCDGPGTPPVLVATIKGDSVFHPSESGRYRVKVLNSVATQLQLYSKLFEYTAPNNAVIASAQNALQQYNKTSLFLVYPNPAKDILFVQTNSNASFSLLDQSGKILLTKNINGKGSINISGIAAGLYYLRNNATGGVQKVVVTK